MDVNQMGGFAQAIYILAIMSGLFGVMYFFYKKIVEGPESEE